MSTSPGPFKVDGDRRLQDYLAEAKASIDVYYEFHQPGIADQGTYPRLLESIAESLISIAESLTVIAKDKS